MAYFNASHPGLAYGDGVMQGAGGQGKFVKLIGNDTFAVNTDPAVPSFGILMKDYVDGDLPGIWCCGGVYETDVFTGTINPNELLKIDGSGKLIGGATAANAVAQAVSVSGGLLKFKLLV
jgi:hypothetical protein